MDIKKLQDEVDKDLTITKTTLHEISMRAPILHNKYYKKFLIEKLKYQRTEREYDQLFKKTYHFYNIDYEYTLDKKEVLIYINGDDIIIKKKNELAFSLEKIKYLESILDNINRISFNVKNAIDFLKFTNGEL